MLHVFFGEDDYSIRQALEEIKQTIGDQTAIMTNSTVFDGRQVTAAELRMACETVPFLAEKRLVIVEGLLEKYETGGRTRRKKAAKKNGEEPEEWKAIAEGIRNLPEFTELVIIGGKVSERNPLLKELAGTGRVKPFPSLRPAELTRWVTQRITRDGGSIAPRAADMLVRFVGNDLWMMANEAEKLVQYTGGRTIEEQDVQAVVSATQEANIFAMVDAILEGRTARAQDLYQQLLTDGVVPVQLLVMISRQVRILFQMKDMRERKKTRNEIRAALGLTSD
ncbi:MAG: DNA polymerase III subunit delta, partial [Dehalococcoidales bacterium]|nr:DNA polymerase III subunit delta [Dehalococcoidales bacterium]